MPKQFWLNPVFSMAIWNTLFICKPQEYWITDKINNDHNANHILIPTSLQVTTPCKNCKSQKVTCLLTVGYSVIYIDRA
jgi:hypothetical protein